MSQRSTESFDVLLLPGWLDSGPAHWQSRWEAVHGYRRVDQADWLWPRRGDWMARLDEVVLDSRGPLLLAAHSLGCQLVASWAAHSQHTAKVGGALLVAPPDTERDDSPPNLHNWRPIVRTRLPFASIVVVSSDDPFCDSQRSLEMATVWGADVIDIGARGHINGESGLGDWPEGHALLQQLMRRPA
jgi:predicted alpha/beta hydrolase family esterase